jgi:Carboxypeptidase regulatory-like domain
MRKINAPLLLAFFIAISFCAKANTHGGKTEICLNGYVTDAVTKKPVKGVTVSAVVPGLNISKEVTTDAEGYFSFSQICGNLVDIQFEKKGYHSYKKSKVTVKEKVSVKVNVEFLPEAGEGNTDENDYPLLRMLQMN